MKYLPLDVPVVQQSEIIDLKNHTNKVFVDQGGRTHRKRGGRSVAKRCSFTQNCGTYHVEGIDHVFEDVVYAKTTLALSTSRLGGYYSLSSHRRVSFSVTLLHPGSMNDMHVQRHLAMIDFK